MASLQPLRTTIQRHLPSLRCSPCLLVTSSPSPNNKLPDESVNDFVQSSTQLLIAQNIRSIPITIDAAFPTKQKVEEALTLAHRAGLKDGVVVGVGSGPAIDLAKALSSQLQGSDGNMILAPATLSGVYAACSSRSLLLDTNEEMLLPQHSQHAEIAFDAKYFSYSPLYTSNKEISMAHVAAAMVTILLDTARIMSIQGVSTKDEELKSMVMSCASVLQAAAESKNTSDESSYSKKQLLDAMLQLSEMQMEETMPQTLANALFPTYFPQNHILTYLGCMLPGLCETFEANGISSVVSTALLDTIRSSESSDVRSLSEWATANAKEAGIPTMASLAFGTPDMKTLLNKVDAYATLTGENGDLYLLSEVIERSLNR